MEASEYSALKILLLGSKSHGLTTLRTALHIAGVSRMVQVAHSARAIEMLCMENFDAVFFDMSAAPVEGMPFAIAARRTAALVNPRIPIFLLQEWVSRRDVEAARDMGATDVLTCPLSPKTVMTKLQVARAAPRSFIAAPDFFGPDRRAKVRPGFHGSDRRVRAARKVRMQTPESGDTPVLL